MKVLRRAEMQIEDAIYGVRTTEVGTYPKRVGRHAVPLQYADGREAKADLTPGPFCRRGRSEEK